MVLVGQVLRSSAMIKASTNFSHTLAFRKAESHRLVTDGIYSYVSSLLETVITHLSLSQQLGPSSFVCGVLLLGVRHTAGTPKPIHSRHLLCLDVEVFHKPDPRQADYFCHHIGA